MPNTMGKGSLIFGLILICIGSLFLMQNWYGLDWVWSVLATWWPLALIALGLWKVIRFFSYNSR
jgi:hypothetical protein